MSAKLQGDLHPAGMPQADDNAAICLLWHKIVLWLLDIQLTAERREMDQTVQTFAHSFIPERLHIQATRSRMSCTFSRFTKVTAVECCALPSFYVRFGQDLWGIRLLGRWLRAIW